MSIWFFPYELRIIILQITFVSKIWVFLHGKDQNLLRCYTVLLESVRDLPISIDSKKEKRDLIFGYAVSN